MNPLELMQFVEANVPASEQLNALALLADAPGEDFQASIHLPVQNALPALRLGGPDVGSLLANMNHGVAGPVIGQASTTEPTLGELLIGETDGTA